MSKTKITNKEWNIILNKENGYLNNINILTKYRIIRRYDLEDENYLIFPPGYFHYLFVSILSLFESSHQFNIWEDGMELITLDNNLNCEFQIMIRSIESDSNNINNNENNNNNKYISSYIMLINVINVPITHILHRIKIKPIRGHSYSNKNLNKFPVPNYFL